MNIHIGTDGIFAVFQHNDAAYDYHNKYGGHYIAFFGGYENAVCIQIGFEECGEQS